MKIAKKLMALSLAAVMAGSCLTACGDSDSKSGSGDAKTLVIGGSGPLTGGAAQYGVGVKNAAQLAVDEINEAGGVNGVKFKLVFEDDEADNGDKAVNAYNALKDKGMQVMLGTVTTGSCLAVIDKTNKDNIFQITPSASAKDVIKNDNTFQVCFTDPNQGKASADYIADNNVAKKVAVIYDSSDAYSQGIYNTFKSEAAEKGLELVAEQSFTKDSKTDFSAQITAAKNANAELLFLPIHSASQQALLLSSSDATDSTES